MSPFPVMVRRLGRISFDEADRLQRETARLRQAGQVPDTLFLLEHEAVVTLGKSANQANLLVNKELLEQRGVAVRQIDRGGDVTFHGPGQVVAYPVVSLRERGWGARRYVEALEQVMIRTAADFGVTAERRKGLIGIWVQDRKLGAIGVRVSAGVTRHGLALNVDLDLSPFSWIVPCGITNAKVTSLSLETGKRIAMALVLDALESRFLELFR